MSEQSTSDRITRLETRIENFQVVTDKVYGLRKDVAVLEDRLETIKGLLKELTGTADEIREWQHGHAVKIDHIDEMVAVCRDPRTSPPLLADRIDALNKEVVDARKRIDDMTGKLNKGLGALGTTIGDLSKGMYRTSESLGAIRLAMTEREGLDAWTERAMSRSSWWSKTFSGIAAKVLTAVVLIALATLGAIVVTHYGCETRDGTATPAPSVP